MKLKLSLVFFSKHSRDFLNLFHELKIVNLILQSFISQLTILYCLFLNFFLIKACHILRSSNFVDSKIIPPFTSFFHHIFTFWCKDFRPFMTFLSSNSTIFLWDSKHSLAPLFKHYISNIIPVVFGFISWVIRSATVVVAFISQFSLFRPIFL